MHCSGCFLSAYENDNKRMVNPLCADVNYTAHDMTFSLERGENLLQNGILYFVF